MVVNVCDVVGCCSSRGLMFALACWQNTDVLVQHTKTHPLRCRGMFEHGNLSSCLITDKSSTEQLLEKLTP